MRISDDDRRFLRRLEAGEIAPAEFRHADHVRLAWAYLLQSDVPTALDRVSNVLRRLSAAAGAPERYHETTTWAYIFLIHERIVKTPEEASFAAFAAANPDLLQHDAGLLDSYYSEQKLATDVARRIFVMPDLPCPAGSDDQGARR